MPAAMTTRTGLFMFISSLKRVFLVYGFIILQTMPDNKTKLFFETRQVFIAYIGKQILPFAFRQGIITSSDTKTTGQPLLQAEAKKPFSQALHTAYESSFWKVSFSMNETVTKRFLLYFRLMMVAWILIANAFFHAIEFEYSWLIFLSNIMLFTMEGDVKDRFISVELGGLVGMVLTVLAMLAIGALTPVLGGMLGLLLPLGVVLFILIILHPYAPKVLNNVGFAYLTVACIDSAAFAANLPLFFGVYIVGSLVFNGGCVLLMKPARYLAARSIKNDVKADA